MVDQGGRRGPPYADPIFDYAIFVHCRTKRGHCTIMPTTQNNGKFNLQQFCYMQIKKACVGNTGFLCALLRRSEGFVRFALRETLQAARRTLLRQPSSPRHIHRTKPRRDRGGERIPQFTVERGRPALLIQHLDARAALLAAICGDLRRACGVG